MEHRERLELTISNVARWCGENAQYVSTHRARKNSYTAAASLNEVVRFLRTLEPDDPDIHHVLRKCSVRESGDYDLGPDALKRLREFGWSWGAITPPTSKQMRRLLRAVESDEVRRRKTN